MKIGVRKLGLCWENVVTLCILLSGLGLWEWLSRNGRISALFFPAPTTVAQTLIQWVKEGSLTPHLVATVSRMTIGFGIGGMNGLFFGLLMGYSQKLHRIFDPFIAAIHPIPKIAIVPLFMVLLGIGEASKIAVIAIAAFFPMVINTMQGVRQIHPIYFEVAHNYGANALHVFKEVVIPGSLPLVLTGIRLALNMALLITLAIELITAQQGLGTLIWLAWETLRTDEMYASLIVTVILGLSINAGLQWFAEILAPWQEKRRI